MNAIQTETAEAIPTTIVNGYVVNAETREVLGIADKPQFEVTDLESLDWVLKRMRGHKARVAAFQAHADEERAELAEAIEAIPEVQAIRAQLKALDASLESATRDHVRALEWLERRYSDGIREVALQELDGKKTRTLKTLFGSVSFRHVAPRVLVEDEPHAIDWLLVMGQGAAVKQTIQVSKLTADVRAQVELDAVPGLKMSEPEDRMSIEVGL